MRESGIFYLIVAILVVAITFAIMIVPFQPSHETTCQSVEIVEYSNDLDEGSFSVAYTVNGHTQIANISADDFYAFKAGARAQECEFVGNWTGFTSTILRRIEQ